MATGYDRRQPTRDTFAFQPVAPVQAQTRLSGQSRGAQLVGGQSAGGVALAGPQTNAAPIAGQLGAYVEEFMRPHLERRQQEGFFKGFTKAQQGVALDELTKSNRGISRIFGPTAFEQGAQFYAAKEQVDRFLSASLADMDQLKRLPPDEAAKLLSEKSLEMLTGDPFADQLIQGELIEKTGPLMQAIGKHRYAWQQDEAKQRWTSANKAGAASLQDLAVSLSEVSDPSDDQRSALDMTITSFRGSMAKPEGMDDETYRSGLFDFMRGAMQDGQFYAVTAMQSAGIDRIFNEDERIKLEAAYDRYSSRVLGDAAQSDEIQKELGVLYSEIKFSEIPAEDVPRRYAQINQKLRAMTGVDADLFDWRDYRAGAASVVDMLHAAHLRAETRRQQIEDRDQRREWDLEDQRRETETQTAQVQAAWGMGLIKSGLAQGLGSASDYEILAVNEYASGNFGGIARAYRAEGWVSSVVSSRMQARVSNALGEKYTNDFRSGYQEWAKLHQIDRAAAAEYYGKLHLPMSNFHRMVQGGMSPNAAYIRAMGNAGQYSTASLEPSQRQSAEAAIDAMLDKNEPFSIFGFAVGGTPLNKSGRLVLKNALTNRVALVSANSDLPQDQIARQEHERFFKAGEVERYGEFAWRTGRTGSTPLATLLKLQPGEAADVIQSVIRSRVRAVGGNPSHSASYYEFQRQPDDDGSGNPVLIVQYLNEDLGDKLLAIRMSDFRQAADEKRRRELRRPVKRQFTGDRNMK